MAAAAASAAFVLVACVPIEPEADSSTSPEVQAPAITRGAASELDPVGADAAKAQEVNLWMREMSRWSAPDSYWGTVAEQSADELQRLADSYPVAESAVPAELSAAAGAITAGKLELGARDYEAAAITLEAAPTALNGVYEQLVMDAEAVEADTGWRLTLGDDLMTTGTGQDNARVERWIDGDTMETSTGEIVRLIGIDTPEMSQTCSQAEEALAAVQAMAPEGATITLRSAWTHEPTDKYGRSLRYVELADGTDVGYSLLLSDLAEARYDSRDGYRWHLREKAYRDTGGDPGFDAACAFAATGLILLEDDDRYNDDGRERSDRMSLIERTLAQSGAGLGDMVVDARATHETRDREAARKAANSSAPSDWSFDFPDSLCPTRWC
ncbi:thermonuclease family protein [Demequina aurantiaca]|uniref:thermonuclease family protein n=1 Tax=Demequina aurantiaca TaxID=676200 RepID=UPI003D35588A